MIFDALNHAGLSPGGAAFWLVLFLLLAAVFFIIQTRRVSRRNASLRHELERTRVSLAGVEARAGEVDELKDALTEERVRRERLEADAAASEAKFAERERTMAEMKARMDAEFKAAMATMLDGANKQFLARADESFKRYREKATSEGEHRHKALDDLLKPVSETLVRYEKGLADMRAEQHKSRGELQSQIGGLAKSTLDVRLEAQKLATALRASPTTRGRWGEEQLRNVVEIAGMAAYVDFEEQASHHDGDRRKQPDMVVRLPGGRAIAVDSKVSLEAYLNAVEAETDEARTAHFAKHAEDLWAHVKNLAKKDYASSLRDSLDFVVMFVPGENHFAAAMKARPQLYQDAFDRKILIVTPTLLIALLKTTALNWRQEKVTENAQAVAGLAKELYDSLRVMGGNMAGLGKALENAVKKYNSTVGGLESRVMSRARKFADYELPGIDAEIALLPPVDDAVRDIREDKELLIDGSKQVKPAA